MGEGLGFGSENQGDMAQLPGDDYTQHCAMPHPTAISCSTNPQEGHGKDLVDVGGGAKTKKTDQQLSGWIPTTKPLNH